jgi:hypothetical protein
MVVQFKLMEVYKMSCKSNREFELIRSLSRFIGETVTIYTTSGGESGRGFTGVLIGITSDPIVRLLSQIGPAPSCALGSCCDNKRGRKNCGRNNFDDEDDEDDENMGRNRFECGRIRNTGAIVDIPVNRIAAFVHNSL